MTDKNTTQRDESSIKNLSISDLRKWAELMGIAAQRDWTVTDFVRAIKEVQDAARYTQQSSTSDLEPGYAYVIVHKDPTPGHSNSAIPLGLNGRMFNVPRGIKVAIPIEYVGVLADAKSTITVQKREPDRSNPQGLVVEETIQSYPFQVLEVRPHTNSSKFESQVDHRRAYTERRMAFRDALGKWPTAGELFEWEKNKQHN